MVKCGYCLSDVTFNQDYVQAASFREAYQRVHHAGDGATIQCQKHRYRVLTTLGYESTIQILLAERVGPFPERVFLKVVDPGDAAASMLQSEFDHLKGLHGLTGPGSAYFNTRLPQVVSFGLTQEDGGLSRQALVLRYPPGVWGHLEQVRRQNPSGIDARHAVWMWRRMLEVLAYIHANGWVHGNLMPENLWVNPADHGITIMGWSQSNAGGILFRPHRVRDLRQSAWVIRALLAGSQRPPDGPVLAPEPLASLIKSVSENLNGYPQLGAEGIDEHLKAAAQAVYGPPKFVKFSPTSGAT